ncbi:S-layer protein [Methanocaldococcus sp. 16A]
MMKVGKYILFLIYLTLLCAGSVWGEDIYNLSSETFKFKYVFPLVYNPPIWGTDYYGSGLKIISLEQDTQILIDANFNGPDSSDPVYNISPGGRLYIGDFPDISNYQKIKWDKNPIIIYSNKPIIISFQYDTQDWGDYDDAYITYAAPQPGTKLIGVNVKSLYITPTEKGTNVYINGKNMGYIEYGQVLNVNFSTPQTVVLTADSPIVAVSVNIDPSVRSRTYAFPLMPPMSGKFLIPNSIKNYAKDMNALSVDEYYVVLDSNGNIVMNQTLPSNPQVITLNNSEVFVFRTFYYQDPWGGNAPRYAMCAQAVKPAEYSTLYGEISPVNEHTVDTQLRFYAAGNVTVYKDYGADGSIDSVETLPAGSIYKFSCREDQPDKRIAIYVYGNISGYCIFGIGWSHQIEGAVERGSSPQLVVSQITNTPKKSVAILTIDKNNLNEDELNLKQTLEKYYDVDILDPSDYQKFSDYKVLYMREGSEPIEYNNATVIQSLKDAVRSGSTLITEAYGHYLIQYMGLGSVIISTYWPVVHDEWYYVMPCTTHPIFNGIPTWDNPVPPDKEEQLIFRIKPGTIPIVHVKIDGAQEIKAYILWTTYGWPYQSRTGLVNKTLCEMFPGACSSERSVIIRTIALDKNYDDGKIFAVVGLGSRSIKYLDKIGYVGELLRKNAVMYGLGNTTTTNITNENETRNSTISQQLIQIPKSAYIEALHEEVEDHVSFGWLRVALFNSTEMGIIPIGNTKLNIYFVLNTPYKQGTVKVYGSIITTDTKYNFTYSANVSSIYDATSGMYGITIHGLDNIKIPENPNLYGLGVLNLSIPDLGLKIVAPVYITPFELIPIDKYGIYVNETCNYINNTEPLFIRIKYIGSKKGWPAIISMPLYEQYLVYRSYNNSPIFAKELTWRLAKLELYGLTELTKKYPNANVIIVENDNCYKSTYSYFINNYIGTTGYYNYWKDEISNLVNNLIRRNVTIIVGTVPHPTCSYESYVTTRTYPVAYMSYSMAANGLSIYNGSWRAITISPSDSYINSKLKFLERKLTYIHREEEEISYPKDIHAPYLGAYWDENQKKEIVSLLTETSEDLENYINRYRMINISKNIIYDNIFSDKFYIYHIYNKYPYLSSDSLADNNTDTLQIRIYKPGQPVLKISPTAFEIKTNFNENILSPVLNVNESKNLVFNNSNAIFYLTPIGSKMVGKTLFGLISQDIKQSPGDAIVILSEVTKKVTILNNPVDVIYYEKMYTPTLYDDMICIGTPVYNFVAPIVKEAMIGKAIVEAPMSHGITLVTIPAIVLSMPDEIDFEQEMYYTSCWVSDINDLMIISDLQELNYPYYYKTIMNRKEKNILNVVREVLEFTEPYVDIVESSTDYIISYDMRRKPFWYITHKTPIKAKHIRGVLTPINVGAKIILAISDILHSYHNTIELGDFNRAQLTYFGYPDSNYDDPVNITPINVTPLPKQVNISISLEPNVTKIDNYTIIIAKDLKINVTPNISYENASYIDVYSSPYALPQIYFKIYALVNQSLTYLTINISNNETIKNVTLPIVGGYTVLKSDLYPVTPIYVRQFMTQENYSIIEIYVSPAIYNTSSKDVIFLKNIKLSLKTGSYKPHKLHVISYPNFIGLSNYPANITLKFFNDVRFTPGNITNITVSIHPGEAIICNIHNISINKLGEEYPNNTYYTTLTISPKNSVSEEKLTYINLSIKYNVQNDKKTMNYSIPVKLIPSNIIDLSIESINISNKMVVGETYLISAKIKNNGKYDMINIPIRLFFDLQKVDEVVIDRLNADEEKTIYLLLTPNHASEHNITVAVQAFSEEVNRSNNFITTSVKVFAKPVALFNYTPVNPTTSDTINFTDESYDLDGNITSWHWDFGDGTTSNVQNPTHKYTRPGRYVVTLTVTDNDGYNSSISKTIVVRAPSSHAHGSYYYGGGGGGGISRVGEKYPEVAHDIKSEKIKEIVHKAKLILGSEIDKDLSAKELKTEVELTKQPIDITEDCILIGGPVANPVTKKYMWAFPVKVTNDYPGKHKGVIEKQIINGHLVILLAGSDRWGTKAAIEYFKILDEIPDEPIFVEWKDGKAIKIEKP